MPKATTHRLPDTVQPERYRIELRPDLRRFTFRGEESVSIRVLQPVKTIELNALDLRVTQAALQAGNGPLVPAAKIELLKPAERLRLTFAKSIPKGTATLHLVFDGTLNDELAGFYRSRYTMENGSEGYMAATQFESTDARRAFPCWDEPATKATFDLSLVVPDGMAAVSNTPVAQEKDLGDGTRRTAFQQRLRFILGEIRRCAVERLFQHARGCAA